MKNWNQNSRLKGEKNGSWKNGKVGYGGIHMWIKENWGKASKCENESCTGNGSRFEWSLKKGRNYSRKKTDYRELCSKCHRQYDAEPWDEARKKRRSILALRYKRNNKGQFTCIQ